LYHKLFKEEKMEVRFLKLIGGVVLCCVGLLAFCLWGIPQYRVYEQRLSGQAKLAEAEYSRQVLIKEAEAKAGSC
jgi:hypothetical protein